MYTNDGRMLGIGDGMLTGLLKGPFKVCPLAMGCWRAFTLPWAASAACNSFSAFSTATREASFSLSPPPSWRQVHVTGQCNAKGLVALPHNGDSFSPCVLCRRGPETFGDTLSTDQPSCFVMAMHRRHLKQKYPFDSL